MNTQQNKEQEDFEDPTFERKEKEESKEQTAGQEGESAGKEENTSYFKSWARRFLKGINKLLDLILLCYAHEQSYQIKKQ